jgi:glutamine synthetase
MNLEYVWIDGYGTTRSKTKCLPEAESNYPDWNYDGSSTGQATTENSELVLRPVRTYASPFKHIDKLVLCEVYLPDGTPHGSNKRALLEPLFEGIDAPRFGFEQEFFLTDKAGDVYLPFPLAAMKSQRDYYCSVGANNALERECVLEAMHNCQKAGLNITGMNAEVAPAQWELQIDEMGLAAADGLWMLRYILTRTVERYGFGITLHPKPLKNGAWNGTGCHANFSTGAMRAKNGYSEILCAIKNLSTRHKESMKQYGEDNRERLSGTCETSAYDNFSYGVSDRSASIRIPTSTYADRCGYFEDRRPGGNMDPYLVSAELLKSVTVKSQIYPITYNEIPY